MDWQFWCISGMAIAYWILDIIVISKLKKSLEEKYSNQLKYFAGNMAFKLIFWGIAQNIDSENSFTWCYFKVYTTFSFIGYHYIIIYFVI